jgi:hypothetical protein
MPVSLFEGQPLVTLSSLITAPAAGQALWTSVV